MNADSGIGNVIKNLMWLLALEHRHCNGPSAALNLLGVRDTVGQSTDKHCNTSTSIIKLSSCLWSVDKNYNHSPVIRILTTLLDWGRSLPLIKITTNRSRCIDGRAWGGGSAEHAPPKSGTPHNYVKLFSPVA